MSSHDDLVIIPSLQDTGEASFGTAAQELQREERILDKNTRGRKSIARRLNRARMARKLTKRRRTKSRKRRLRSTRGVSARAAGTAGKAAGRSALLNPVGLLVATVAVAGVVATRLATGRSFENIGAQLNKVMLGDMDDEARANMKARQFLKEDEELSRIAGQEGRVNSQIASIFADVQKLKERDEVGRSLIQEDKAFQVNKTADFLILRARDGLKAAFDNSGGQQHLIKLRDAVHDAKNAKAGH